MIVKLILSALLLYYIGVLWKYYRHDIAGIFGKPEETADEPGEEAENPDEPYTVIGKSTYRNGQTNEPGDKQGHADNQVHKTDNFAPGTPESEPEATAGEAGNKPETATGTPADNGTEEAEETAPADDDADYSDIEVEPEEDGQENEYVPTPEELKEMEEEEELGAYYPDGNPDFATGYTFEDLKKVHRVLTTDDADEREKQQAREVLPAVMGSDVWEEMLDEFEGARQRVARLMNSNNV